MGLWAKILAFFRRGRAVPRGGSVAIRPPMNIPAPNTLLAKIDRLDDEGDRQMLHVAEEALRRGFPEESHVAYWKALRHYIAQQQFLKAISVAGAILKLRPDDLEAMMMKAECCLALDRRRDAAFAFMEVAALREQRREGELALQALERCIDLDKNIEGLRLRYQKLGGRRDVWSEQLPSSMLPAQPLESADDPALTNYMQAVQPRSSVLSPVLSPVSSPPPAAPSSPTHPMQPNDESISLAMPVPSRGASGMRPKSAVLPAPAMRTPAKSIPQVPTAPPIILGKPEEKKIIDETSIELHIEPDPASRPPPAMTTPRPPVRFNIPKDGTAYDPGLPSAILGTEHEAEASGDVAGLPSEEEHDEEQVQGDDSAATIAMEAITPGSSPISDAQTQAIDASQLSALLKKVKVS